MVLDEQETPFHKINKTVNSLSMSDVTGKDEVETGSNDVTIDRLKVPVNEKEENSSDTLDVVVAIEWNEDVSSEGDDTVGKFTDDDEAIEVDSVNRLFKNKNKELTRLFHKTVLITDLLVECINCT